MINPILSKAITHYGTEHQTIKAIEEMSELTKELAKELIGDGERGNIIEEMADVEIMLEQLHVIYGQGNQIELIKQAKIDRLAERLVKSYALDKLSIRNGVR